MSKKMKTDTIYNEPEGIVCHGCGDITTEFRLGETEEGAAAFCLDCSNNA